jgi:type IV pilus assembly protein PilA
MNPPRPFPAARARGFTLIEMVIVFAVIAILALMAVPSFQERMVRSQIVEAAPLSDIAKQPVAASWATQRKFPKDNAAAGLPVPEKIVGNYVKSVALDQGAIHITFGNKAHQQIKDKILSFRPAVVEDAPIVPVTWVCGHASAPAQMKLQGEDKTNIEARFLPLNCQKEAAK